MKQKLFTATTVVLAFAVGAALAQDKGGKKGPAGPGLTLMSSDFEDGGVIPDKYSQKGGNANAPSPHLTWDHVPNGTMSFTLLMHDPDVALQKSLNDVTHWLIFDIPGDARELKGGVPAEAKLPDGAINAKNLRGGVGYMGPGAPAAGPFHHYTFELFALDEKLNLGPDATREQVMMAMNGHILGKGVLEGRFHQ